MHTIRRAAIALLFVAMGTYAGTGLSQERASDEQAAFARVRPFFKIMFGVHYSESPAAGAPRIADLSIPLARLEQAVKTGEWIVVQEVWTPAMLRKAAGLLGDAERGERVARGWGEGRSLTLTAKAQPDCQVAVGIIRFQDASAARAYIGLAVDLQRKQDDLLNAACADGRRVVESRSLSVQLHGVDESAGAGKILQRTSEDPKIPMTQLWARKDNRVVEFTFSGRPADTAWAQRAIDIIQADSR